MNHEVKTHMKKGFTLIELMLAMTFISLLLVAIAMTIVQIANTYNRGTMTKDINQSSREISDELQSSITSSGSFSTDPSQHHYVEQDWGGRLCVGNYSYIWNYPKAINVATLNPSRNVFKTPTVSGAPLAFNTVANKYEISLVKVVDTGSSYCIPTSAGVYPPVDQTKATELLRSGDHSFVLHYFDITEASSDTVSAQSLYKITFVLGTSDTSALTGTDAAIKCIAPGDPGSDADYCNVQKFTLVLRVASGVN